LIFVDKAFTVQKIAWFHTNDSLLKEKKTKPTDKMAKIAIYILQTPIHTNPSNI
jgi:hypothetical protein